MKYVKKIFLLLAFGLFLAQFVFAQFVAPPILRKKILKLGNGCQGCHLELGAVSLSLLRSKLELHDIYFTQGDPYYTRVESRVNRLQVDFTLRDLLRKFGNIQKIWIYEPDVVVTEGDGVSPEKKEQDVLITAPWKFKISDTEILNGKFLYSRTYGKKNAPIHVKDIYGIISSWESEDRLKSTKASITGVLEQTGMFELKIAAPLFAGVTQVEVDLVMRELNLANMDPYFTNSEGLSLKGSLYLGRANVQIQEEKADAWVKAQYVGLDLDFHKTKERGAWTTFLSDLVSSLKVKGSNLREPVEERVRGVSVKRKSRESLVSFVLRGMKEAALKVAVD